MPTPGDIGVDDTESGLDSNTTDDHHATAVRAGVRQLATDNTQLAGEVVRDGDEAAPVRRGSESVRTGAVIGGRYRIIDAIARGSMSRVYRAEQMSIRRPVALKVIGAELARDGQAVSRFRQEAAVLANIAHPNIVQVFDIGTTASGEPYLVMELVRGHSLADVIKAGGRLEVPRTIGLLLQMTRALATVHEAGVVHRDMKPGNVLLAQRRGGPEVAKVVDFGLAKVVQERGGAREFMTRTGTILGTPEYMSPEQIRGGAVDHRADIYSLGCLAYEMLTGAPPFTGEEMSTLYRHMHEKPKPMKEACPDAAIGDALQTLVDRALAKDPDERFENAHAFYRALLGVADQLGIAREELHLLDSFLAGSADATLLGTALAVPDRTSTTAAAVAPPPRKSRTLELALVAVVLALAGVIGGVLFERSRRPAAPAAAAAAEPAGEAASRAAAPAGSPELLVVTTVPSGAQVLVDGTALGETTPTAVRGLAPGRHRVGLRLAGYADVDREIFVTSGGRAAIDVRLPPPVREVTVRAVPADSRVFLDGELVSQTTPARLQLGLEDFHEIRVEKDGYQPKVLAVTPDDRDPEVEAVLETETLPFGTLWVDASDVAAIWIDGMDSGYQSPSLGLRLRAGKHTVELRDSAGGRSGKAKVEITQGQNIHVVLDVDR